MEVKKELINKAAEECKKNGATVRYSGAVLKIHDTIKGTAKRILIVTNLFITYYKTGSKPVEDRKNYWRDISSFNYEDNRIELYFDKAPFRFISDNSSEIFDIILEIFLRCFTPDEIAPLDLSRFAHPPLKVNGCGILNRNSIILASTNTVQNSSELEDLKKFVEYSNPSFEVKGSNDYIRAVLETVRAAPYLNILIFPKMQETKNLYKNIEKFIQKPSNVHMISLSNRPDDNFTHLSKKYSTNNKSIISALKFTDAEIEEEDLERLKEFIVTANIESLSFCHSLPSRILNNFTEDFLKSEAFSKLSYLCLDSTKISEVSEIIDKLSNISILSLCNCNLEISEVFKSLTISKIQSLRYLNLSHNKCSYNLKRFRLPPYLERIDLNNIKWSNSTLPQFLTQLFNKNLNDDLKLYINKINIEDHEWDSVFNTFETLTKYPLTELSWNHNKLSRKFFDFLSNNIQISHLFLNGCFTHTKEEEITQFSRILPNLTSCTHLVIKGDSDTYTIREKFTILFDYIKQMSSISYLDISNNLISNDGLDGLSNLINECNRLTYISFDGSKFDDQKCFEKLIDEGEKRRRPLYINWPTTDLKFLKDASKINDINVQAYKDKLISLSTGISNTKTKALRNSMQIISNNMSALSKSSRMSMRMLKNENSAALKEKKNQRSRSTVRDIRTASFRGVKRPNLLVPEKSHMEFDHNSPLNRNFEVYKSFFTHKFPDYLTQKIKNIFACNPIQYQELDDAYFSDENGLDNGSVKKTENLDDEGEVMDQKVVNRDVNGLNTEASNNDDDDDENANNDNSENENLSQENSNDNDNNSENENLNQENSDNNSGKDDLNQENSNDNISENKNLNNDDSENDDLNQENSENENLSHENSNDNNSENENLNQDNSDNDDSEKDDLNHENSDNENLSQENSNENDNNSEKENLNHNNSDNENLIHENSNENDNNSENENLSQENSNDNNSNHEKSENENSNQENSDNDNSNQENSEEDNSNQEKSEKEYLSQENSNDNNSNHENSEEDNSNQEKSENENINQENSNDNDNSNHEISEKNNSNQYNSENETIKSEDDSIPENLKQDDSIPETPTSPDNSESSRITTENLKPYDSIRENDKAEISSKSATIRTIEISQDYESSEEEDVIELSLLNDPQIPRIDQLTIQKNDTFSTTDFSPDSLLLKKIQQLPKLNKIECGPPLFQLNELLSGVGNVVDRSSLKINNQTKELDAIKDEIAIDDISDFQSSEDFESDGNLDDIKTLINMIKDEEDN